MCCFRQRTTWGKPWLDCFMWPSVRSQLREAGRTVRAMLVTAWEEAYNLPHTTVHFLTQEGHYADLRQPREVYAAWTSNHERQRHRAGRNGKADRQVTRR